MTKGYRGKTYVNQIGNVPLLGTQSYVTYESTVPNASFQKAFMRLIILEGEALPAYWQLQNFGHTGVDPNADPDGDGISNFNEYVNGTNPNDFYNGISPTISIVAGGNQGGAPLTVLATPLTLSVYYQPNAPLTISVTSGTAMLSTSPIGSNSSSSITMQTSNAGGFGAAVAQVYLTTGTTVSDLSTITITAPGYPASTITTTVGCYDPTIAAPTNLVATVDGPDSASLTWTNNSANGTAIWESLDYGATWQYVTSVASGVSTYEATGLPPGQSVQFETFALNASGGSGGSGGAGGSAPSQPSLPVSGSPVPILVAEVHSGQLQKNGAHGFQNWNNYYLTATDSTTTVGTTWGGNAGVLIGSDNRVTTYDPMSGNYTTTGAMTGVAHGEYNVIQSDTLESINTQGRPAVGDTTFSSGTCTLSNLYTTDMFKANVLKLVPFTNTFVNTWPLTTTSAGAYYQISPDESYIYMTDLQYKFKVSPQWGTATFYWIDEFWPAGSSQATDTLMSWTGSGVTETPVYQITGAMLEAGVSGTHAIYPIYPVRDGQLITSNNNTVAVGQQVNLSLNVPIGLNITNYQWNIPGTIFKDYQPDAHNSHYTALLPTDLNGASASSVSFYWSDAADNRQITCTFTLNGQNYTIPITLNVKRPTGAITATVGGPIAVDGNFVLATPAVPIWLHFGAANDSGVGMTFSKTITLPPDMPKGTTGKFCWAQVISGTLVQSTYTDTGVTTKTSYGEDTSFPYGGEENDPSPTDSPGNSVTVGLHQSKSYRDFGATMYLFWQPTQLPLGESAVWVPLRGVYWHWNGTAISSDGVNWTMQSSALPSNVNDFPVTTEPQWTKNVTDP